MEQELHVPLSVEAKIDITETHLSCTPNHQSEPIMKTQRRGQQEVDALNNDIQTAHMMPSSHCIYTISGVNEDRTDEAECLSKDASCIICKSFSRLKTSPKHYNLSIAIIFATVFRIYALRLYSDAAEVIVNLVTQVGICVAVLFYRNILFGFYLFFTSLLCMSITVIQQYGSDYPSARAFTSLLYDLERVSSQHVTVISWYLLFLHTSTLLLEAAAAPALTLWKLPPVHLKFEGYKMCLSIIRYILICLFAANWAWLLIGYYQVNKSFVDQSYYTDVLFYFVYVTVPMLPMIIAVYICKIVFYRFKLNTDCTDLILNPTKASKLEEGGDIAVLVISLICYGLMLLLDHSVFSVLLNGSLVVLIQISLR